MATGTRFAAPIRKPLLHLVEEVSVMWVREICDEKMGLGKSQGGCGRGIPPFKKRRVGHPANLKAVNKGERFDVGVSDSSSLGFATSTVMTVSGFVQVDETDLGTVQKDSLYMKSVASLSVLELGLWRAGLPAISNGLTSLSIEAQPLIDELPLTYQAFALGGGLNCIVWSAIAAGAAKTLENAPL
jgi:hypothetical protein